MRPRSAQCPLVHPPGPSHTQTHAFCFPSLRPSPPPHPHGPSAQLSVPFPPFPCHLYGLHPSAQISLLKRSPAGGFDSAGDILGTVEPVPDVGNVFFVRFFEGPVAQQDRRWVYLGETREGEQGGSCSRHAHLHAVVRVLSVDKGCFAAASLASPSFTRGMHVHAAVRWSWCFAEDVWRSNQLASHGASLLTHTTLVLSLPCVCVQDAACCRCYRAP